MNSQTVSRHSANRRTTQVRLAPRTGAIEMEQENVRLRLALRESRHRSSNQWQLLIGLAELESLQQPRTTALGCSVRLSTMAHAFVTLNRALDTNIDVLTSNQKISVRGALESVLALLQAVAEEDALYFAVQDAWLSEKGCTALMLICAELVCNATKYGKKTTELTFRIESGLGVLEVRDDGPGFPAGFCVQE
jgi:two-component sensor histidine kinase